MASLDWLSRAVFYQIFPASFHDGNGDGIGDLTGIEAKLGYLADLGVNALLINVCYESPFRNGGFDVADHSAIAARYGTLTDAETLIAAAHARDMRICFDLVPGHTSNEHRWFLASSAARGAPPTDGEDRIADRYLWHPDPRVTAAAGLPFAPGLAGDEAAYAYETYVHQPAVNFGFALRRTGFEQAPDAPGPRASWRAMREIVAFWLDRGLDGFRVLAPHRLVRADPWYVETRRHWGELNAWVRERYPDAAMISSWGVPELATDAGFAVDMLVDAEPGGWHMLFGGAPCFERAYLGPGRDGDFGPFWRFFSFQHERLASGRFAGLPSGGPDLPRLNAGRSEAALKLIYAFLLTWPAVPFIYYGDEVGMRHRTGLRSKEGAREHTASRTPMQWTPDGGFSTNPSATPYLPVDADETANVAAQRARRDSLWHHIERLVYLRATELDLAPDATIALIGEPGAGQPLVYRRGQGLIVALNPGPAPRQVRLPRLGDVTPVLHERCQVTHDADGWMLRLAGGAHGVFNVR
jgi:maltose alpha-D-glucosyltransferase / alpha-amylase